jgi:hypothetical protein
MTAKSPADRYQTPAEVARALEPFAAAKETHEQQSGGRRATPLARPVQQRTVRAALAAAALLVLLAATVITVTTDKGTLTIEAPAGADVSITISDGGDVVQMVHLPTDSRVQRLPSGEYKVDLNGGTRFQLDKNRFRLRRGDEVVLTVTAVAAGSGRRDALENAVKGAQNLVRNAGFEDGAQGNQPPPYWIALTKTLAIEPEARCSQDSTTAHQGGASARVEKTEVAFPQAEAGFLQSVALPGGKLTLSGYLKTNDVKGAAAIKLRVVDPQRGPAAVAEIQTQAVEGTTDWTRYRAEVDVPAGSVGELGLVIQGTGTVWFDEISLVAVENLLENGGFDQRDESGQVAAWRPIGLGMQGLEFRTSTDVKHAGEAAARIQNTVGGLDPWNWRQEVDARDFRGQTLRLHGWARTEEAGGAAVGVQLLDAEGRLIAFHTTQHQVNYAGTVDWRAFDLEFAIPAGAERIAVLAMLFGKGQVWFDDFHLTVVGAVDDTRNTGSEKQP